MYESLDPLPAILPLKCNGSTGQLVPYKLDPVWPSCQEPKFCSVSGITPPALIPANLTANTFNYTEQSWLLRDETITQVREYDFLEFTCNNTLHVSGNTSTFKIEVTPYVLTYLSD